MSLLPAGLDTGLLAIIWNILTVIGWIIYRLIKSAYKGGKEVDSYENQIAELRSEQHRQKENFIKDIQGLHKTISINNNLNSKRYGAVYTDLQKLYRKYAAWTGDSNGNT